MACIFIIGDDESHNTAEKPEKNANASNKLNKASVHALVLAKEYPAINRGSTAGIPIHKNSVLSSRPIEWGGRKERTRPRAKTVDLSHGMCYNVSYETETRLSVSLLPDGRAKADACSYLWLCAFRLQLGLALAHRRLL